MSVLITDQERALYQWQRDVTGFGDLGQEQLKAASVLVSRCGGVGGALAHALAAAGVGRLFLAHAGNLRPEDLNRQLLMTHARIGQSRAHQAAYRLRRFNPFVQVIPIPQNATAANVDKLAKYADVVACCAPRFAERLALKIGRAHV